MLQLEKSGVQPGKQTPTSTSLGAADSPSRSTDAPKLQPSKSDSFLVQQDPTREESSSLQANSTDLKTGIVVPDNTDTESQDSSSNLVTVSLTDTVSSGESESNGQLVQKHGSDDSLVTSTVNNLSVEDKATNSAINGELESKLPLVRNI